MQDQSNDGGGGQTRRRPTSGIEVRHGSKCASQDGGRCSCSPTFRAYVWSRREKKRIRSNTYATRAEAKGWLTDANTAQKAGTLRAPTRRTLNDAAAEWLAGVEAGRIDNRSGDPYKPSTIRSYRASLERLVLPALGTLPLSDISRLDVQDFVDGLRAEGRDPSTIRNTINPLRAIFRRAAERNDVGLNPVSDVRLAAVRGRRDRIATPEEAQRLLEVIPEQDRALWATAFYAGLRRGELLGLRWEDVDLAGGEIHVERSWDVKAGPIEPKSQAGRRKVPIAPVLRDYLDAHKLRQGRDSGLVFGRSETRPFNTSSVWERARKAWAAENKKAEEEGRTERLEPIGMHECRHVFASLMSAADVRLEELSEYMGHASIAITYDRYRHLMPGRGAEDAARLDAYLERANTRARLAQIEGDQPSASGP